MNIYKFNSYCKFLIDYIQSRPKGGRGEILRMAEALEVHPSLVSQVLNRLKDFNLEQAMKMAQYLNLTSNEIEYFMNLVQLERASTPELIKYFQQKIKIQKDLSKELHHRVQKDKNLTDEEKATLYSHWLYLATWLLTSLKKGKTLEQIAEWFNIPKERVESIIKFLVDAQLCQYSNGHFVIGHQSVHIERGSPHLYKHHSNWRLKAIEAADQISSDELMYTAPISISKKDFDTVREKLLQIIKEVTEVALKSEAENIACFNLDFFWLKSASVNKNE